jgi:ubiquinone/menaquinone biosynthesis C-methylase UbiE
VRLDSAAVERFSGFSSTYDKYRPRPPRILLETILAYSGREAPLVADLGSGTGISAFAWGGHARKVIGIEPNADFLAYAQAKARTKKARNLEFLRALASETGLKTASVDIATCSQAFHWMEPKATLAEIDRILKPRGVFAVYDCDWPPAMGLELERLYAGLVEAAEGIIGKERGAKRVRKWDKAGHLGNIRSSGYFSSAREIVFHAARKLSADGIVGLCLSQGSVQSALKNGDKALATGLVAFERRIRSLVKEPIRALFGYRLIVAAKRG